MGCTFLQMFDLAEVVFPVRSIISTDRQHVPMKRPLLEFPQQVITR